MILHSYFSILEELSSFQNGKKECIHVIFDKF